MGASESKPSSGASHVWKSETPVRFSQDMVDSLQASNENDSTRAKTLELHIQARVADELKRLQAREDQAFKDLTEKLSAEEPTQDKSSDKSAGDALRGLGRESVQQEVAELKRKLEARKKVKDVKEFDAGVEKAREGVIACLRGNDRRPLDCWKEVETFKAEVRRLESSWVEKVVR